MGFFNKIKSAANFITGKSAIVTINTDQEDVNGNEPIKLLVKVVVKDSDIKIKNCYVKIRATETVVARDLDVYKENNGSYTRYEEDVTNEVITFQHTVTIGGEETLLANKTYNFDVEVEIPEDIPGSYYGRNASHEWEIYAGLDMAGNDPDSGWVEIEVWK